MNNTTQYHTIWQNIQIEAQQSLQSEPALANFLTQTILDQPDFEHVLAFQLASKLSDEIMDTTHLTQVFLDILLADTEIIQAALADIEAYYQRDPACDLYSMPLLYFKGFHAIQSHRINHHLWQHQRRTLAYFLQNRISQTLSVDIHPAARFGQGIMIDHGTGVVIGETAVLGNNISILHGVTLGGSGKEIGDRHPKIGDGVMIGANASVLGNINIGQCAKIGAGSVVVADVEAYTTVVGVPARVVGRNQAEHTPAMQMDQRIDLS